MRNDLVRASALYGLALLGCDPNLIEFTSDAGPHQMGGATTGAGPSTITVASTSGSTGGASGGDGGDGSGGAAGMPDTSADVTGTVTDTYISDAANGDEQRTLVPRDLSNTAIEAIWPSGESFVTRVGSGTTSGTFTIAQVPALEYYLRVGADYLRTTDCRHVLGKSFTGRPDVVRPAAANTLVYDITGLEPWETDDIVELVCIHNDSWDVRGLNSQFGLDFKSNPPLPGATSLAGASADLLPTLTNLIDKDHGDVALVTHLASKTSGALHYQAVTRSLRLDQLQQVDGQPLHVTGTLTPVPQSTLHLDFRQSEFDQFRTAVHPAAQNTNGPPTIAVFTAPAVAKEQATGVTADLLILAPAATSDAKIEVSFGNPFPSSWGALLVADSYVRVTYAVPGASSKTLNMVGVQTYLSVDGAGVDPVRPLLGPVSSPEINMTDAFNAVAIPHATPSLSWSPPSFGTAASYKVVVREALNSGGLTLFGNTTNIEVGSATSITILPGIMAPGHHYVLRILARTGTSLPKGTSNVLTGLVSVNP